MSLFDQKTVCKYCVEEIKPCKDEGIQCLECNQTVHLRCLKRGSVPGGLHGDVFFTYKCAECSASGVEVFIRNKASWMQIIVLVLYHLREKRPGLARRGFFHWRHHVASFIDKNWDIIFPPDTKMKKKWRGTIAGTLSHFSPFIFVSGTSIFNEPAWWTLKYTSLSPYVITQLHAEMINEKGVLKSKKLKVPSDAELFHKVLGVYVEDEEYLQTFIVNTIQVDIKDDYDKVPAVRKPVRTKRKGCSSSLNNPRKLFKDGSASLDLPIKPLRTEPEEKVQSQINCPKKEVTENAEGIKLYDPFCHYNTSLNKLAYLRGTSLYTKITGGIRREPFLSPYSEIYLKPYIRRDTEVFPAWLKLMAEIQLTVNTKYDDDYELPPRAPIDYTYVQPEHIPAINSLCNQFFWPGIDLTDSLKYPDFSCVVLYKRLIVGFAFLVPDVSYTENYMSFCFTRPGWRNCGIGRFMVYHLIQTSLGKDITLHVSINNPALFLYQKFGFKVEKVVLDFYDKYLICDYNDKSKHAFFCRLER
ncbi:unnamed protein product [Callosobruchus maculatus]|uniref:Uncharacterized protein n=1 Tax=Callosobruchus maculatus TaxID=64391 RepID=A0A653BHP6_CALMS|nr:unnamed protein product [Callosobruchus maculatus]